MHGYSWRAAPACESYADGANTMSDRIHVHDTPRQDAVTGWVLSFDAAAPIGPFESANHAAAFAGEWTSARCCVVPVINPVPVLSFLHRRECQQQFGPSTE